MSNILAVEFYRLKKSKLFWILLGVTAALPLLAGLFELAVIELMDDLFEMMASEAWVIADQMNLTTQGVFLWHVPQCVGGQSQPNGAVRKLSADSPDGGFCLHGGRNVDNRHILRGGVRLCGA